MKIFSVIAAAAIGMIWGCSSQDANHMTRPGENVSIVATATQPKDEEWIGAGIECKEYLFGDNVIDGTLPPGPEDGLCIQDLDNSQLHILQQSLEAMNAQTIPMPHITLPKGIHTTLQCMPGPSYVSPNAWQTWPRLDISVEETADHKVRLVIDRVYSVPAKEPLDPAYQRQVVNLIVPRAFPFEKVMTPGTTLMLQGFRIQYAGEKTASNAVLILIRVSRVTRSQEEEVYHTFGQNYDAPATAPMSVPKR